MFSGHSDQNKQKQNNKNLFRFDIPLIGVFLLMYQSTYVPGESTSTLGFEAHLEFLQDAINKYYGLVECYQQFVVACAGASGHGVSKGRAIPAMGRGVPGNVGTSGGRYGNHSAAARSANWRATRGDGGVVEDARDTGDDGKGSCLGNEDAREVRTEFVAAAVGSTSGDCGVRQPVGKHHKRNRAKRLKLITLARENTKSPENTVLKESLERVYLLRNEFETMKLEAAINTFDPESSRELRETGVERKIAENRAKCIQAALSSDSDSSNKPFKSSFKGRKAKDGVEEVLKNRTKEPFASMKKNRHGYVNSASPYVSNPYYEFQHPFYDRKDAQESVKKIDRTSKAYVDKINRIIS